MSIGAAYEVLGGIHALQILGMKYKMCVIMQNNSNSLITKIKPLPQMLIWQGFLFFIQSNLHLTLINFRQWI